MSPLVWRPFIDGRMAVGTATDGTLHLFFDGGAGHARADSYGCRMTPAEARLLALAILGQIHGQTPLTELTSTAEESELGRLGKLALMRREKESILIGDDCAVCVVEIRRGYVKLCVTAPRNIPIYRPEALARMQAAASTFVELPAVEGTKEVHIG